MTTPTQAQVGEPITAFVERAKLSTFHATIERCAQVAEKWHYGHDAADAIRKLKDKPGKEPPLGMPFPEE